MCSSLIANFHNYLEDAIRLLQVISSPLPSLKAITLKYIRARAAFLWFFALTLPFYDFMLITPLIGLNGWLRLISYHFVRWFLVDSNQVIRLKSNSLICMCWYVYACKPLINQICYDWHTEFVNNTELHLRGNFKIINYKRKGKESASNKEYIYLYR